MVKAGGLISAAVADSCTDEIFSDTTNVSQQVYSCDPVFPNVFTPNGDGLIDEFYPVMVPDCSYLTYRFQIFARRGELIFETDDPHATWNGKHGDVLQPMDVYGCLCSYAINDTGSGKVKVGEGNVTLLR